MSINEGIARKFPSKGNYGNTIALPYIKKAWGRAVGSLYTISEFREGRERYLKGLRSCQEREGTLELARAIPCVRLRGRREKEEREGGVVAAVLQSRKKDKSKVFP